MLTSCIKFYNCNLFFKSCKEYKLLSTEIKCLGKRIVAIVVKNRKDSKATRKFIFHDSKIPHIDVDIPFGKSPHLHTSISSTRIEGAIVQTDLNKQTQDVENIQEDQT